MKKVSKFLEKIYLFLLVPEKKKFFYWINYIISFVIIRKLDNMILKNINGDDIILKRTGIYIYKCIMFNFTIKSIFF